MYDIGRFNEMNVVRKADFGVYLGAGTGSTSDDILLPNGSVVGEIPEIGDTVRVFIYRDSEDRIIATMKEPLITVGEVKKLKVVEINDIGAFISMGLERDVFVPRKEQKYMLEEGKEYLFKLYLDKSKRLAATTDVNGALEVAPEGTFEKDQEVQGTVYSLQPGDTFFVALGDTYKSVLNRDEYFEEINPGDVIKARILKILEDGRPVLTMRSDLKTERLELKDVILKKIKENKGSIPYNDKSTPEEIREEFKTSKNYFKIALGNLMKSGLIYQDEKGTHIKK